MRFPLGLDLASLIPANIEVEATNASVRFSSAKYKNNGVVANGDSMIKNKSALIDDSECEPHSIVNMSELLASSAAAYAHKVTARTIKNDLCVTSNLTVRLQL